MGVRFGSSNFGVKGWYLVGGIEWCLDGYRVLGRGRDGFWFGVDSLELQGRWGVLDLVSGSRLDLGLQ